MQELLSIFQDVDDPRKGNAKRHDLHEMLVVALLSMLAGGRTCVDMEDYGGAAEPWLRTFLALENGIPSHDTFSRLFARLDPAGLQKALLRLAQDWADRLGDVVAVDGKALRRSFEDASERSPTHLLQAFAAESKLTLAQVEVDGKSNEIPALPELLELVDVKGRTVTADALHAQRGTAAAIVAKGGDYALALKGNQGTLHADVAEYLDNPPESAELLGRINRLGRATGASRSAPRRSATTSNGCRSATAGPASRPSARWSPRRHPAERNEERRRPLLPAQRRALRRALRPCRALPLGDREQPALACSPCPWTKTRRATAEGQLRRLSRSRPPAGLEHRADASRQAVRPPQVVSAPSATTTSSSTSIRRIRKNESGLNPNAIALRFMLT